MMVRLYLDECYSLFANGVIMNKFKWLNALFKSLLLTVIVSFVAFSECRMKVGIAIGFFLKSFSISDNICGWIGFFGFPMLLILVASALILKSYPSWMLSIPMQFSAYSICLYLIYEACDFAIYAKFCGTVLAIEALAVGIKTLRRWCLKQKKADKIM